jgi:hypothetical protein
MEKFEDKINKEEEEETEIERQRRERAEYLIKRTENLDSMKAPTLFYWPEKFKAFLGEQDLGGFDSENLRKAIADKYKSNKPEFFYLYEDYIFVIEKYSLPVLASTWRKKQEELKGEEEPYDRVHWWINY